MHPERVELFGNPELVHDGEIDAFTLAAVAQGGVVDFDFGFGASLHKAGQLVSETGGQAKLNSRRLDPTWS
jgi:hypothetical protein